MAKFIGRVAEGVAIGLIVVYWPNVVECTKKVGGMLYAKLRPVVKAE